MDSLTNLFSSAVISLWNSSSSKPIKWKKSWTDWASPTWHQSLSMRTWKEWMIERKRLDGAEGLWRIHDNLYDLSSFKFIHPGGAMWMDLTKGTDITEAFEAHHISNNASAHLPRLFVRKASSPRNSPFTFHEDGFYSTLKRNVATHFKEIDRQRGAHWKSTLLMDFLAGMMLIFASLGAYYKSITLCAVSGLFLSLSTVCSHNLFHQPDSWRMYYFNFSLLSLRDWRVSHALSHHLYPNTLHDLEVAMFEPWFQWIPRDNKTFIARYVSWLYAPIVYSLLFHIQASTRLLTNPDGWFECIPLIIPALMMIVGNLSLFHTIQYWTVTILIASFIFGVIGVNAAHHHPQLFHDGDKPREGNDWGLYQLDAVKDRVEIKGVLPLALILFGEHSLHHLFPSLDHAYLDDLYPILEQTCKQFNYEFKLTTTMDLVKGQFLQLARTTVRS